MSTIQSSISNLIEKSIERLRFDLKPLEQNMLYDKKGMFIGFEYDPNMTDIYIVVYAAKKYQAYVPKKYDGWDVKFFEWNGEEIQIDNLIISN